MDNYSNKIVARFTRLYFTWFSKVIIDCNRYIYKRRSKQIRIYLSHGMPLKIAKDYLDAIGDCDLISVSGSWFVDFFSSYVPCKNIRFYGLPRNDILCTNSTTKEKYIIWMPTFRQHKSSIDNRVNNIFPLGIPILKSIDDISVIDSYLKELGIKLMLRPHPAQDLSILKVNTKCNIIIADDEYLRIINKELYSFIADSSALITDYSSVYYDYLLLNRPIGLTFEDINTYTSHWPLIFQDIEKELPGIKLMDIDDLKKFIDCVVNGIDRCEVDRNRFLNDLGIKQKEACKLITNHIVNMLNK